MLGGWAPRNEALEALKSGTLKQKKDDNDYNQHSLSEPAIYRYKQLLSSKLSLRDDNAPVGEALTGVKAMNKVIELGIPVQQTTT